MSRRRFFHFLFLFLGVPALVFLNPLLDIGGGLADLGITFQTFSQDCARLLLVICVRKVLGLHCLVLSTLLKQITITAMKLVAFVFTIGIKVSLKVLLRVLAQLGHNRGEITIALENCDRFLSYESKLLCRRIVDFIFLPFFEVVPFSEFYIHKARRALVQATDII